MMRFRRPRRPPTFETAVQATRDAVAAAIATQQKPAFDPLWGDFKPAFAAAQRGKCGYCEIAVIGGQDGDVEHYAPKSELTVLGPDATTWGEEAPNSSRVRGRKPQSLSERGYWWLAYSWSNYLLACAVCNQKWKKTIFPVKEPPQRTVPPAEGVAERSLLLNPFRGEHPAKHLHFQADGSVEAWKGSRHGLETIKTVGLDRPSIRFVRQPFVSDAYQALRELADARLANDDAAEDRALRDIVRLGQAERQFSGAVRTIVEHALDVRWQDVEAAAPPP
jgi:hypothetical protein